jgi:ABC-type polysaccharide/polyol phosphate transport system ATPase subunit
MIRPNTSEIAIRVEGIGKLYHLGKRERQRTLRDTIVQTVSAPLRFFRSSGSKPRPETIWALKDVSFEIRHGEVIGIIGRNGSGKSTLLKVLSRITEPTEGRAAIHGRVGSLLEVGTGFHTELTGRENILLNGAILGMKRVEIQRKFDEMVAFSEVEKFIDTPVKHYSSGMYLRLAFAVAAHLDPEILIVDEVLAVGDANFQKKCLGKMGDVAKQGRTVLLVSHQLNQIRRLCHRCLWLDSGVVRRPMGPTGEIVNAYELEGTAASKDDRSGKSRMAARYLSWTATNLASGQEGQVLNSLGPVQVSFKLEVNKPIRFGFHGIALYNAADHQLLWAHGKKSLDLDVGYHDIAYTFDLLPLKAGTYNWLVTVYNESGLIDSWEATPSMSVTAEAYNEVADNWSGILNLPFELSIAPEQSHAASDPDGPVTASV